MDEKKVERVIRSTSCPARDNWNSCREDSIPTLRPTFVLVPVSDSISICKTRGKEKKKKKKLNQFIQFCFAFRRRCRMVRPFIIRWHVAGTTRRFDLGFFFCRLWRRVIFSSPPQSTHPTMANRIQWQLTLMHGPPVFISDSCEKRQEMISPSVCIWTRRYYRSVLGGGSSVNRIRENTIHLFFFFFFFVVLSGKKENNKKKRCRHQGPLIHSAPFCTMLVLLLPRRSRQSPSNTLIDVLN